MTDKGGRPSKLTEEIKQDVFNCIVVDKLTIRNTAKKIGINTDTIYNWLSKDDGFSELYTHAQAIQAHDFIDRCKKLADELDNLNLKSDENDRDMIKNKILVKKTAFDMYLRLGQKLNRRLYGETIDSDITSNGKEIKSIAIVPSKEDADKWGKK